MGTGISINILVCASKESESKLCIIFQHTNQDPFDEPFQNCPTNSYPVEHQQTNVPFTARLSPQYQTSPTL